MGSYNDYKKEDQFLKLQAISDQDNVVTCIRDGEEKKVHYNDLVVGDIIKIKGGMNIPVDGVAIECNGVTVNESAMTGESDELKKDSF